tara:strand:- start:9097 stop:11202 length:2106 start_codon:yes stop_codon:yes gene_type:complete
MTMQNSKPSVSAPLMYERDTFVREAPVTSVIREKIARKIGYDGPMSGYDEFLASSLSAQRLHAQMTQGVTSKLASAKGGIVKRMAQGGLSIDDLYQGVLGRGADASGRDFYTKKFGDTIDASEVDQFVQAAKASPEGQEKGISTEFVDDLKDRTKLNRPDVAPVEAAQITTDPRQEVKFDPIKQEDIKTVDPAKAATSETIKAVDPRDASKVDADKTAPKVSEEVSKLKPVTGDVREEAQVQAQTEDVKATALKNVQASEIDKAVQIDNLPKRKLDAEELVAGPSVKSALVEQSLDKFQAAQANLDPMATTQGQLETLTKDFDAKNPPAWAAGSLRKATAVLNQRGLGASSLAGQAVIQAIFEQALPIAQSDAQTVANLNIQNLSNRQQRAVIAGQQRAQFLGQEFDQAFQTRVTNAAKISDIANQNFTSEVQVTLENARMAQSVDLANLNNRQAVTMATAAQMANLETTNLNNRQQAEVQNAQAFLQMDMKNLDFAQQTNLFKTQSVVQSILTDTAAENAAKQFNATSENQVNQFYDSMNAQISQFNVSQNNALEQFNVSQTNSIRQFNAQQKNAVAQFNASNGLVVSQANAQWRQQIATVDTATQNQVNQFNAANALNVTMQEYENVWQEYRDQMSYAWETSNNEADRMNSLALQIMTNDAAIEKAKYQIKKGNQDAAGVFVGEVAKIAIPKIISSLPF